MLELLPFFLAGLAGSVHCAGMCGGIVTALSLHGRRTIPLQLEGALVFSNGIAYNSGRITSYMAAGALAGGVAPQAGSLLLGLPAWQAAAAWAANAMLVLLGLYLMGASRALAWSESAGSVVWRRVQPMVRRLGQGGARSLFLVGAAWGWLPCGMVYSMLTSAMLAGSASGGASIMLAFGLGTLPLMLLLGSAGQGLRSSIQAAHVRTASGLLVLGYGLLGFWRGSLPAASHWLPAWCLA